MEGIRVVVKLAGQGSAVVESSQILTASGTGRNPHVETALYI